MENTELKKDDLPAIIVEHFLLDYVWYKQTKIAPVLALSTPKHPSDKKHLQVLNCIQRADR